MLGKSLSLRDKIAAFASGAGSIIEIVPSQVEQGVKRGPAALRKLAARQRLERVSRLQGKSTHRITVRSSSLLDGSKKEILGKTAKITKLTTDAIRSDPRLSKILKDKPLETIRYVVVSLNGQHGQDGHE